MEVFYVYKKQFRRSLNVFYMLILCIVLLLLSYSRCEYVFKKISVCHAVPGLI